MEGGQKHSDPLHSGGALESGGAARERDHGPRAGQAQSVTRSWRHTLCWDAAIAPIE